MLTIAGLVLGVWFMQIALLAGPAPMSSFLVAAMAVAMLLVGLRYILKAQSTAPNDEPRRQRPEGDKKS